MKRFEILRRLRNIEYKINRRRMTVKFKVIAKNALEVFTGELDIADARKWADSLAERCDKLEVMRDKAIAKAAEKAAKKSGLTCPMSEREDVTVTVENCPDFTQALTSEHTLNGPLVVVSEWTGQAVKGECKLSRTELGLGLKPVARITHQCSWCGEYINPGTRYVKYVAKDTKAIVVTKLHQECEDAINRELEDYQEDEFTWPQYSQKRGVSRDE